MNMIIPHREDAVHKAMLYRMLMGILDKPELSQALHFKGGTCAAMLGYLNRFSVDLDFDLDTKANKSTLDNVLQNTFRSHGFSIKEKSKTELFYILKYTSRAKRNTLKVSVVDAPYKHNTYSVQYLSDIDRYSSCQTIETMFANKLVSLIDRYEKHTTIAGRDIYDIHSFFSQGLLYNKDLIVERRNKPVKDFFEELIIFIEKHVSDTIIIQDLNYLLPKKEYNAMRRTLKQETLMYVRDELERNV